MMKNVIIQRLRQELGQCERNSTVGVMHARIRDMILSGEILSGERLPSARQLSEKLGIAHQTVGKVYGKLELDGMAKRPAGSRQWFASSREQAGLRNIGIVLAVPFMDFFLPGPGFDVRFGLYCGIVERAAAHGFGIMPIYLPPPDASEEDTEKAMNHICNLCAGVIHFGDRNSIADPPLKRLFDECALPQVSVGCEIMRPWIGSTTFDSEFVARTLVGTLREYGHRNFCVVYPFEKPVFDDIHYTMCDGASIRAAFRKAGVPDECISELVTGIDNQSDISVQLDKLLSQSTPPTAFWCRSERFAVKLIALLNGRGYNVPGDISVIGFDDLEPAQRYSVRLTSFHYPLYDVGAGAVDMLINLYRDGTPLRKEVKSLPAILVVRDTLGIRKAART